jgi:pSer/pThr/pTyr-binding forkhead associated (FHA) protein
MPLIRCPECGQAYNVPPQIAVRLPTSVANCRCGHWLCGSREGLLSKLSESGRIEEIDLSTYHVDLPAAEQPVHDVSGPSGPDIPQNVRVIAKLDDGSFNRIFTISSSALWIGRRGCHIDIDDAELSIQHCSISVRGDTLVITDAQSYTGTYLDGQPISETRVEPGVHLLRVGSALLCIEPVEIPGDPVEPLQFKPSELFEAPTKLRKKTAPGGEQAKVVLRCVEGAAAGKEFDIPPDGVVIGREGSVKVPDEYLSRKHFSLAFDSAGALRVKDLGSRNGTFLNTLPARNTKVAPGDEIRAGLSVFRVEQR